MLEHDHVRGCRAWQLDGVERFNIRVIDSNGELIRQLTLDPSRNYQPLG